ncbi:putative diguanylate cyclase YegE [Methylophaga muralis]|uniref:Putative diguanylate cyclase YegE n=3 Tax=Methylophaga TaxID=40222 RepID=A0A1E3GWA6_9GAMM|nr:putative diguanylate cyclase YegE [Methylophaga muralis]
MRNHPNFKVFFSAVLLTSRYSEHMSKHVEKWFFNRTFIVFVMVCLWFIGALSLRFFYHQQVSGYQSSIHSQISQRVSMSSALQAELIDKEFSFLAANLKQLGSLSVESPKQVSAFAMRLKNLNPSIWHITIADSKGEVTFSTRVGYQPPISLRDYFAEHLKSNQINFFISSPRQSVIQESALYIAMSYPIRNPEGEFLGVAVTTLTSEALTAQLGKITNNKNISAVLTDQFGKLIWSSNLADGLQKGDVYSLCKDNKYQTSTDLGIYRIKLDDNAQCDFQFLDKWGMYSIVAENLTPSNQLIQRYQNQMVKRNIIILLAFSLLLMILGYQLLKQIESRQLLAVLNQRNKAIIDAMPDLLLTMRIDGTIIDYEVEESFPLLMSADKLNGLNISEVLEPELVEKKLALMASTVLTGEPATLEYPLMVEGKEYYFLERLTALDDKHVLAFIIDITSRREAESKLEWQAYHDGLTGLANRLMFFEFINKLIQDYRRNKREFTILFIDLNGFKAINDNYGHHAGDEILKHTANHLLSILRQTDTLARLGGDEFAVLLPETSPAQAQRVIETIADAIQKPLVYLGNRLCVTASIGMASCPQDATSADELINTADKRMYEVKLTDR